MNGVGVQSRYKAVCALFIAWCVLSWAPDLSRIQGSDVGFSELCMLAILPCLWKVQRFGVVDLKSTHYRSIISITTIFLIFWGGLAIFQANDLLRSGRYFLSLFQGLILLYVTTSVVKVHVLRLAVQICAVLAVLTVMMCIAGLSNAEMNMLMFHGKDRAYGMFKHPNQLGIVLAMGVPFAVSVLLTTRHTIIGMILLMSLFGGLALSGSKTNIVVASLMLVIASMYAFRASRQRMLLIFVIPMLATIVFLFGVPTLEIINPRAASILNEFIEYGVDGSHSLKQRQYLWDYSMQTISTYPVFGEGTGQRFFANGELTNHSHNVFLDYGRTVGFPGMMGIFIVLFTAFLLAVKTVLIVTKRQNTVEIVILTGSCFAVVSYILSNQMSDSFGPATSFFFWLSLGVVVRRRDFMLYRKVEESVKVERVRHKFALENGVHSVAVARKENGSRLLH